MKKWNTSYFFRDEETLELIYKQLVEERDKYEKEFTQLQIEYIRKGKDLQLLNTRYKTLQMQEGHQVVSDLHGIESGIVDRNLEWTDEILGSQIKLRYLQDENKKLMSSIQILKVQVKNLKVRQKQLQHTVNDIPEQDLRSLEEIQIENAKLRHQIHMLQVQSQRNRVRHTLQVSGENETTLVNWKEKYEKEIAQCENIQSEILTIQDEILQLKDLKVFIQHLFNHIDIEHQGTLSLENAISGMHLLCSSFVSIEEIRQLFIQICKTEVISMDDFDSVLMQIIDAKEDTGSKQ